MNIWLIKAGESLPSDPQGDRLLRMGLIAKYISEKKINVTWFNSTYNHSRKVHRYNKDTILDINHFYRIYLIHSIKYKNLSLSRILHHHQTANKFYRLANKLKKPDLIFCSMPTIELSKKAVEISKKHNIPIIFDIRDLWPDVFKDVLPNGLRHLIKPLILYKRNELKKILCKSTGITALTESYLNWALNLSGLPKRLTDKVFKMGYESFSSSDILLDQYLLKKHNLDSKDFNIVFFGHLGKQFNFDPVFQAAKLLLPNRNIKFIICGNGDSYDKYLIKTMKTNNIIFTGWINSNQIQTILSISKLGLAPYRNISNFQMNIPNKIGEYLSNGIPLLVGVSGEMRNLVEDNNCGYFYHDGIELARIILDLYSNKLLHSETSLNAIKVYNEELNSSNIYGNLVEYFINIINKTN